MSRQTFEQLRVPIAIGLVALALLVFWPRGSNGGEPLVSSPTPTIVVGEAGGAITSTVPSAAPPSPSAVPPTPSAVPPTPTAAPPTPAPTAVVTPAPTPAPQNGFTAEVLACRSISGSTCNQQLGTLPANAASFTALVRFTAANGGDQMNAVLSGPSGTIPGFPYTLQGGGDGYYYSQFQAGGLPGGEYRLTATRNGVEVAATTFRIAGGP